MSVESREDFVTRTEQTRQKAHVVFRHLGFRQDKATRGETHDCTWYECMPESHLPIHFEEYSYVNPMYRPDIRSGIRSGREISYMAYTWVNDPHMRFEIHSLTITSKFDILAAQAKLMEIVDVLKLSKAKNMDREGSLAEVQWLLGDVFEGVNVFTMTLMLTREQCSEYCPGVLKKLESRRDAWEESYLIHFSIRVPCVDPLLSNVASVTIGETEGPYVRARRIHLRFLACELSVGGQTGDVRDSDTAQAFDVALGADHDESDYKYLREHIEERLEGLERRICHGGG